MFVEFNDNFLHQELCIDLLRKCYTVKPLHEADVDSNLQVVTLHRHKRPLYQPPVAKQIFRFFLSLALCGEVTQVCSRGSGPPVLSPQ